MMQTIEEYFKLSETSSSNNKQGTPATAEGTTVTGDPSSQMMYQDLGNMSSENLSPMMPRRYGRVLSSVPESKLPETSTEHKGLSVPASPMLGSNRSVIESDKESVGTAVHSDFEEDF